MSVEKAIEEKIRAAIERGEFDNLSRPRQAARFDLGFRISDFIARAPPAHLADMRKF